MYNDQQYRVFRFCSSHLRANAYVVESKSTQSLFVVDTGKNDRCLLNFLEQSQLEVMAVFLTHGHFDHAGTAHSIASNYQCPVFMSEDDSRTLKRNNFLLRGIGQSPDFREPACTLVSGTFTLHGFTFHPSPGHTPGSVLISLGSLLFTGDTVYRRGVGAGQLPGENLAMLRSSIRTHHELLEQSQLILPGHGECIAGHNLFETNLELTAFIEESD